jgi:hypothetical protein
MARSKKRVPRKPRNLMILGMIIMNKNTTMRDKRERRPKDARRVREEFA